MAEYIERDAAIATIQNIQGPILSREVRTLREIPAADVVEVKHGRWIYSERHAFSEECSVCGGDVRWDYNGDLHHYKYCPNCGARMDGE